MPEQHDESLSHEGSPGDPRRRARQVVPDVVPARMVNEVLYCERLMYLEWVRGEFADNHFTVDGRHAHRNADQPGGRLPEPDADVNPGQADGEDEEDEATLDLQQARSVWLTSEALGLTAKIDIVEREAGAVVPVEYKRGKVPPAPGGAYLPEQAQVCAQGLLLRDQGYTSHEGAIYFAGSRRRVAIPYTPELVSITKWAVGRAKELAQGDHAPPPLVDSPKCHGCSVAPICLPDETSLLARMKSADAGIAHADPPPLDAALGLEGELSPDPWQLAPAEGQPATPSPTGQRKDRVRRLYPALGNQSPVYVTDFRSQIRVSGLELVFTGKEGATSVRLGDISEVVLFGTPQITTQAMRTLMERGISVTYLTRGGWLVGRASGVTSNNIDLRMAQHRVAADPSFCLRQARAFIVGKIKNCRTLVRRNGQRADPVAYGQLSQLMRRAGKATSLEALLGLEGVAARTYFAGFTSMLKAPGALGAFKFDKRNRRPPTDPINAMLSLAYSLLAREVTRAVAGVGMEPLLGFYHQPRFGRPALALDLMEEFRPLIADSTVITAINTGVVAKKDFVLATGACNLRDAGRRRFIQAFERRVETEVTHPWFGYRVSYRRILEVQARLLSRVILGELDMYPAFTTR